MCRLRREALIAAHGKVQDLIAQRPSCRSLRELSGGEPDLRGGETGRGSGRRTAQRGEEAGLDRHVVIEQAHGCGVRGRCPADGAGERERRGGGPPRSRIGGGEPGGSVIRGPVVDDDDLVEARRGSRELRGEQVAPLGRDDHRDPGRERPRLRVSPWVLHKRGLTHR